jgi:restriction system protein
MAIPTYDQFIEPLLRYLAKRPDGARSSDVYAALADQVGLTEDERLARLPSRLQPVHHNRIGWAHDRLKRAGLSTSAKRGVWKVTEAGLAFAQLHPAPLSVDAVERLARVPHDSRLREPPDTEPSDAVSAVAARPVPQAETRSPDERIEEALEELNESVAAELLELIADGSPTFFEHLVLDLLHAMGYGTSRADLQRVGGSGDGGIDGIISLDRLGLEKVYIQAKRWQHNVGRPELQSFSGALVGRRAKKGVFITTSGYTKEAREYAESVSDHVVIVDGARLATLMIEHGVGVTHKPIKIAQVDGDYFESE